MKNLDNILNNYENDIKYWSDDFGEGHIFLNHREQLIPFEDDKRVEKLDAKALEVIKNDSSKGSDKLFLKKLKYLINHSKNHQDVA
ncbi:MAG: hypothetical protein U9P72_12525 [Campylobacterota bacterium]|nr:hypothetical protein [Campylobacterota bacterium]